MSDKVLREVKVHSSHTGLWIIGKYFGTQSELVEAGFADPAMFDFPFKQIRLTSDEYGCNIKLKRFVGGISMTRYIGADYFKPRFHAKSRPRPEPWDPMPRVLEIRDSGLSA